MSPSPGWGSDAPAREVILVAGPIDPRKPLAGVLGRDPSSGGGRLAWVTPKDEVVVAAIGVIGGQATIGTEIGRLSGAVGGSLSTDGRWLTARYLDDTAAIYALTVTGLGPVGLGDLGGRRTDCLDDEPLNATSAAIYSADWPIDQPEW